MSSGATRVTDVARAVWSNTIGLLVDDGRLALGAIAALAITWAFAALAPDALRASAGWLLLALVLALLVANLVAAGRNARRHVS